MISPVARDRKALAVHLLPDLAHAVHPEIIGEDPDHLWLQILIAPGTIRQALWITPPCDALVMGG